MGVLDSVMQGMAVGAGSSIIGTGLQLATNPILLQQQISANEEQANYNLGLQEQYWNYTSYPNQVMEMNEAGLNPALMYKGGGNSGMSLSNAIGNVSAAQPQNAGQTIMQGGELGLKANEVANQNKLRNIEGQTELDKQANLEADTALTQEKTRVEAVAAEVGEASSENQIAMYNARLQDLLKDVDMKTNEVSKNSDTYKAQVGTVIANFNNAVLNSALIKAETNEGIARANLDNQKILESINSMVNANKLTTVAQLNAATNVENSYTMMLQQMTNEQRLNWEKGINDLSASSKLTVETIKDIVGLMVYMNKK